MQPRDVTALAALVGGFALFVTAHVCIVAGLAGRARPWRSAVAFFVVPTALYWAARERMSARAVAWAVGASLYAAGWMLGRS